MRVLPLTTPPKVSAPTPLTVTVILFPSAAVPESVRSDGLLNVKLPLTVLVFVKVRAVPLVASVPAEMVKAPVPSAVLLPMMSVPALSEVVPL